MSLVLAFFYSRLRFSKVAATTYIQYICRLLHEPMIKKTRFNDGMPPERFVWCIDVFQSNVVNHRVLLTVRKQLVLTDALLVSVHLVADVRRLAINLELILIFTFVGI